jgi:hypothetical protein
MLGSIPFRSVSTERDKVIAAGSHQTGDIVSGAECGGHLHNVRKHERHKSARRQEPRPGLIETIPTFSVFRDNGNPLGQRDFPHAKAKTFGWWIPAQAVPYLSFCAK